MQLDEGTIRKVYEQWADEKSYDLTKNRKAESDPALSPWVNAQTHYAYYGFLGGYQEGYEAAWSARTPQPPMCPSCGGNDADIPCAYPGDGMPGCPRDKRLSAPQQAAGEVEEEKLVEAIATDICDTVNKLNGAAYTPQQWTGTARKALKHFSALTLARLLSEERAVSLMTEAILEASRAGDGTVFGQTTAAFRALQKHATIFEKETP